MPAHLFKLYQRKKIININLNIIFAGLAAIAISAWPVQLAVHFIQDELGWHAKWIEPVVAALIDGVVDIAIYFGLHWIANHWRPLKPRTPEDECDLCADKGSFWKTATFIQAERYLLSPIFYLIAMGGMWLIRHHTDMAVKWAFAISFTVAILTTRVIHTMWGLRTGRFK